MEALRDKRGLASLARAAGLSTPPHPVAAQAAELARASPRGPWVVKPARPGGALASARLGTSADELHAVVGPLPATEPLLLQERARGRQVSVALVLDREGRVTARFQHLVRRTWPLDGGATALAVGVAPDEELVEGVARLLREAGYWGFAQLDIVESSTGPMPIDANPRFYTSLPLATASGVNLPAAWHAAVTGHPIPGPRPYRTGVTYRWLEADVSTLARRSPRATLRPARRPSAGAIWASGDPLPSALLAAGTTGRRGVVLGRRLVRRAP
ncbi:MAG: ATP-grasp domain-containing protein [Thermoleophilaceae bacterium]